MRRGDNPGAKVPGLGPYWWTPLGFLTTALVVLLAVPMVVSYRVRHLRERLTEGTDRALVLVNDFEAALATELLARDETRFKRTRAADSTIAASIAEERETEMSLDSLVRAMNPEIRARFADLRELERQRRSTRGFPPRDSTPIVYSDTLNPSLALRVLAAAERLQRHLDRSSTEARQRIQGLEHLDVIIAVILVPTAFVSVLLVIWIGRQALAFARALEAQHAALLQATEARSALLRGVTHDVKNPLGAALGYTDLLEETAGPLSRQQLQFVTRIRRLLRVSVDTISELLDLARTDAGALHVTLVESDLVPLVRDVIEDYEGAATEKGQTIALDVKAPVRVRTDVVRARQILGNLVSNAVKYTPKDGRIVVRVGESEKDDADQSPPLATVEVHDSGPGIPPAFRDRVFAEFFRLPSAERVSGTGIGLTISKRMASLIQGDLTVSESFLGGALFTLWLPLERRAGTDSISSAPAGIAAGSK
jgi:signal transduction histidine kinase